MKRISILIVLALVLLPVPISKSSLKQALVYGRIAKLESGQTIVFPDTILGKGFATSTNINAEISGLEVTLDGKFASGDDFLGIGVLDILSGCFDPYWFKTGSIDWDYGVLDGEKLNFAGSKVDLNSKNTRFLKGGSISNLFEMDGMEVDVFGQRNSNGFEVYAMSDSNTGYSKFCGIITGKQESGITDFKASRVFSKKNIETISILAQKNPSTMFFNGSGVSSFDNLLPGRLGYCAGPFNLQSGIMQAEIVISGLNASTFNSRIAGIVTSIGIGVIHIRTMLPGCVPVTVKCSLENADIVRNGAVLTGSNASPYTFAIPGKTVVELFGKFENDQFAFNASLARVDPKALSKYVCGFTKNKSINDIFGHSTPFIRASAMKVFFGTEPQDDGGFVVGWTEEGKMVAVMYPEPGLLGLQIKGILKENRKNSFILECQSAFDERLSGRPYEIFIAPNTKIVDSKTGFIDPQSLEPGKPLNCWGVLDEDYKFYIVLADLD